MEKEPLRQPLIVHVSDWTEGGAARACAGLVAALRKRGRYQIRWFVTGGPSVDGAERPPGWKPLHYLLMERLAVLLCRSTSTRRERWLFRLQVATSERILQRSLRRAQPALIHLHNLHRTLTWSFVERLPGRPIIWTLHDQWPLTGYCCYTGGCEKYRENCQGECLQIGRWGPTLQTPARAWARREAWSRRAGRQLLFAAPSQWMAGQARMRWGNRFSITAIPYGIDLDTFRPAEDRQGLRVALRWPSTEVLFLAGAAWWADPRKGLAILQAASQRLRSRRPHGWRLVVFGETKKGTTFPPDWQVLGPVRDPRLLALYYAAADVFIHPSTEDNLPNTLLEAQACGTPCLSSNAGGCPEIVADGVTGYVVPAGDADALASTMERLVQEAANVLPAMRSAARRMAEQRYDPDLQAARYEELYAQMLTNPAR